MNNVAVANTCGSRGSVGHLRCVRGSNVGVNLMNVAHCAGNLSLPGSDTLGVVCASSRSAVGSGVRGTGTRYSVILMGIR